jgi:hypothetical protein
MGGKAKISGLANYIGANEIGCPRLLAAAGKVG